MSPPPARICVPPPPPGVLLAEDQQRHWTAEQLQAYVLAQQIAMMHKGSAHCSYYPPAALRPPLRPSSAISSQPNAAGILIGNSPTTHPLDASPHHGRHNHRGHAAPDGASAASSSHARSCLNSEDGPQLASTPSHPTLSSGAQNPLARAALIAPAHLHEGRAICPVSDGQPPSRGGVHTPQSQQLEKSMRARVACLLEPSAPPSEPRSTREPSCAPAPRGPARGRAAGSRERGRRREANQSAGAPVDGPSPS